MSNPNDCREFNIDKRITELGEDARFSPSNTEHLSAAELEDKVFELEKNLPPLKQHITTATVFGSTNDTEWPRPSDYGDGLDAALFNNFGSLNVPHTKLLKMLAEGVVGGTYNNFKGKEKASVYIQFLEETVRCLKNGIELCVEQEEVAKKRSEAEAELNKYKAIRDEQASYQRQFSQRHVALMEQVAVNDGLKEKIEMLEETFLDRLASAVKNLKG